MWNNTQLNDRTVVVTGATSGIGRAVALACASKGARLVVCGRRENVLAGVVKELRAAGAGEVWGSPLDVRSRQAVQAWWAAVPAALRPASILVNNAGLARGLSNVRDNQLDDWDEMIDTNLKGMLYLTQAVLPDLLAADSAHIVNIGSLAGVAAYPQAAVYCATKAALKTFTDGLRQDLVDTAVRVCTIQPGMVETEFSVVRFRGDAERASKVYQGIKPLGPEDIAQAVLFALTAPAHVQICELTLTPTHQATGGVVFRA